jgi:ribosomal protein L37AE/L43A
VVVLKGRKKEHVCSSCGRKIHKKDDDHE